METLRIIVLEIWLMIWNGMVFTWYHPLEVLLAVALFWIGQRSIRFLFHYGIAIFRSRHLVVMKVIMPRADSKLDKERETKKDFKETLAVMQQLYRALYEIKELNLMNIISSWIFQLDLVSFEMVLEDNQIGFQVVTFPYYQGLVEKQITAFYDSADIQISKVKQFIPSGYAMKAFFIYLSEDFWHPIHTYKTMEDDPLNDLTNVCSKFGEEDKAVVQMIIRPKRTQKWRKKAKQKGTELFKGNKKKANIFSKIPLLGWIGNLIFFAAGDAGALTNAPGASGGDSYVRMLQTEEERAKRIGEKAGQVGFETSLRVITASKKGKAQAREMMNSIVLAFNVFYDANGNYFQSRRVIPVDLISNPIINFAFEHRLIGFFQKKAILVPEELATVLHFPNSNYNKVPIIKWLAYKVLPPPVTLPDQGILLGYNMYRGERSDVRFLPGDRTRHHYIIGKSGTGKSAFISYIARQDVINGDGVCVVDPHGDLVEDILAYVPKERAKDVIVFDPSDRERPMALNLLEANTPEEMDRASLDAMEIFIKLFGDEIFGPRIQHYFRNACLTLMEDTEEGATLIDVPRMFVDNDFMQYKVNKVKNPVVKAFWTQEYASTGDRERQEMIPYFSSKFGPFITNTTMRNVIGQTKSSFDFRKCMDEGKILLINLSKGKIGDINAQLLGLVVVNKISMAAFSRVDTPQKDRRRFYLYVDEFQNFATDAFATILSEARKYELGLIMAHQYIGQLVTKSAGGGGQSSAIRDAVFGNVGTMMSFKVGAEDADYLAKEYAPLLSEQDIIGIANFKAYIKLNIKNTTSRPFSLETIWDETGKNDKIAAKLKEYSRIKYGRKKEFVDQEINARMGI